VTIALGVVAGALALTALGLGLKSLAGPGVSWGSQEAPVAAVLIFDTSPRMEYRHENRTRLAAAQELADWLVAQFPADSEVAVLAGKGGGGAFAVDRAAAMQGVRRLRTTGVGRPLPELLAEATELLKKSDKTRKEVYIFSDLAAAGWQSGAAAATTAALPEDALVYVVDVGIDQPANAGLGNLELSSQLLSPSGELRIAVPLQAVGLGGEREIELLLEAPDPRFPLLRDGQVEFAPAQRRGTQVVKLHTPSAPRVEFRLRGMDPGIHQGQIRLLGGDALAADDVRYFAVDVQPAWRALLVTGPDVDGSYVSEALAPREFRQTNQARFAPETATQQELGNRNLTDFRVVALLNPGPLSAETWEKLATFVDGGGGLAIFLGHHAQPAAMQFETARRLLGGKLARQTRTPGDVYLAPTSYDHPILSAFRQIDAYVPWDRFPVYYHWNIDDLSADVRTVIAFGNQRPAVVEPIRGRVLVMTTPLTEPLRPRGRSPWNELSSGEDAWPAFVLVNEMLLYLAQAGDVKLNYACGETAVLTNDDGPERYQLFPPSDQPQDVVPREGRVTIRFTELAGGYRLRGQRGTPTLRGFAVNLPAEATDLTRLTAPQLDAILGTGRYRVARDRDQIDRAIGALRVGSEFYPLLMALFALTLGLEHVLANRFYKKRD
jgi:hypothetical protein